MEIKWNNVVVIALLVFALSVIFAAPERLRAFFGAMGNVSPGHSPEEQVMGLMSFGLVLASILAIAIIVSRGRGKE